MGTKLDKVVVIDLEATCWDTNKGEEVPEGCRREIIEIGIVLLNMETGKIELSDSIVVKPTQSWVSPYCTQLTGWTQEAVNKGIPFDNALNILKKKYGIKNRVWCSWGDYDRSQFQKQCGWDDIKYPFSLTHINVKTLHGLMKGLSKGIGLGKAIAGYGWEFEGRAHNGLDDAKNVAKIFYKLMKTEG